MIFFIPFFITLVEEIRQLPKYLIDKLCFFCTVVDGLFVRVVNCKLLPKKLLYLRILFFGNKIFDEEIIRNRLFVLIQENSIRLKFLLFIKCYDS